MLKTRNKILITVAGFFFAFVMLLTGVLYGSPARASAEETTSFPDISDWTEIPIENYTGDFSGKYIRTDGDVYFTTSIGQLMRFEVDAEGRVAYLTHYLGQDDSQCNLNHPVEYDVVKEGYVDFKVPTEDITFTCTCYMEGTTYTVNFAGAKVDYYIPNAYVLEENHTCEFTSKVIDEKYLEASATCNSYATYYYSCICGKAGTETFTSSVILAHDYGENVSESALVNDGTETTYYYSCSLCGAIDKSREFSLETNYRNEETPILATKKDLGNVDVAEYANLEFLQSVAGRYGVFKWSTNKNLLGESIRLYPNENYKNVLKRGMYISFDIYMSEPIAIFWAGSIDKILYSVRDNGKEFNIYDENGKRITSGSIIDGNFNNQWVTIEFVLDEDYLYTRGGLSVIISNSSSNNYGLQGKTVYIDNLVYSETPRTEHVHSYTYDNYNRQTEEFLCSEATCTENARYYLSCACGKTSFDTYEVSNTALGHDYGNWKINVDKDYHTRICSRDNTHREDEPCSGGVATCKFAKQCDVCQGYYGELAEHVFTNNTNIQFLLERPTPEKNAVYVTSCSICGTIGTQTFERENTKTPEGTVGILPGDDLSSATLYISEDFTTKGALLFNEYYSAQFKENQIIFTAFNGATDITPVQVTSFPLEVTLPTLANEKGIVKNDLIDSGIYLKKEIIKLATPVVKVDSKGLATWEAVEDATHYCVFVDGEMFVTNNTSYQLEEGQTVEVIAGSTEAGFESSDKSEAIKYIKPLDEIKDKVNDGINWFLGWGENLGFGMAQIAFIAVIGIIVAVIVKKKL